MYAPFPWELHELGVLQDRAASLSHPKKLYICKSLDKEGALTALDTIKVKRKTEAENELKNA